MPPATTDDQRREIRRAIEPARQDAQKKWAAFEAKRKEIVDSGASVVTDDAGALQELDGVYREAEQAAQRYTELSDRERSLQTNADVPAALLPFVNTDAVAGVDAGALDALKATPGALLASMLERRAPRVDTLPEHIRYAAQTTPITTANVDTATESTALIDLLSPSSVAIASGIPVLRLDTTKMRVPRFTDLPEADWIPELGAFPTNGPGIEMVDVEPPKVGLITEVSIEVFEDLRPLVLAMLQVQLLRAIALEFDKGMLFGSGIGAEPLGIANTPGIQAVTGVPLTSLAAFSAALAALIGANARPGALAMNPLDIGTLLQLTESADGAGSNVPLWKASVGSASGLRLPYFDTPIWPTPACPQGQALMYDPATMLAVIRRDADVAIDPYYKFGNGIVGLRTYLRGAPVVGQVDGAVTIDFDTTP